MASIWVEIALSATLLIIGCLLARQPMFCSAVLASKRPIVAVLAVGALARLAPNLILSVGAPPDVRGFQEMGQSLLDGVDMYQSTLGNSAPYLPVLLYWSAAAQWLSAVSGIAFVKLLRLLPIAADVLICAAIFRQGRRLRGPGSALAYALNPVAILVSAWHGQMDAVAALGGLLALLWVARNRVAAGLAFGFGVAAKSWPVLLGWALLAGAKTIRAKCVVVASAALVVAGFVGLYAWGVGARPQDMLARATGYNHGVGIYGFGYLVRFAGELLWPNPLWLDLLAKYGRVSTLVAILVFGWLLATRAPMLRAAALALLVFNVFTAVFSIQYLVWVVPFAAMARPRWLSRYSLSAIAYMVPTYALLIMTGAIAGIAEPVRSHAITALTLPVWLTCVAWFLHEARVYARQAVMCGRPLRSALLQTGLRAFSRARAPHPLVVVSVCLSVACLLAGAFIMASRWRYPYELEWIEGAYADQARWILAGNPAYFGPPTLANIALNKTPLHVYLMAAVMAVSGVTLPVARAISIIALLLGLLGVMRVIAIMRGGRVDQLFGAAIVMAAYGAAGFWYDLAKNDTTMIAAAVWSLAIQLRSRTRLQFLCAGLLMALSVLLKQSTLPLAVALAVIEIGLGFSTRNRARFAYPAGLFGTLTVATLLWHLASQGWSTYFMIELPLAHERDLTSFAFLGETARQWLPLGLVVAGCALFLGLRLRMHNAARDLLVPATLVCLTFCASAVAASLSLFTQRWTYLNAYIPLVFGMAIGVPSLVALAATQPGGRAARPAMALLLIAQFWLLRYAPLTQVPTAEDLDRGRRFVAWIASLPGSTLVFSHGHYAPLAGKPASFASQLFSDARGDGSRIADPAARARAAEAGRLLGAAKRDFAYDAIVVDGFEEIWLPNYVLARPLVDMPRTRTGADSAPAKLLVPNPLMRDGRIPLHDPTHDGGEMFSAGWGNAEPWGRWSTPGGSTLALRTEPGRRYRVEARVFPFCAGGFAGQRLRIVAPDRTEMIALPDCSGREIAFDFVAPAALTTLVFVAEVGDGQPQPGAGAGARIGFASMMIR